MAPWERRNQLEAMESSGMVGCQTGSSSSLASSTVMSEADATGFKDMRWVPDSVLALFEKESLEEHLQIFQQNCGTICKEIVESEVEDET